MPEPMSDERLDNLAETHYGDADFCELVAEVENLGDTLDEQREEIKTDNKLIEAANIELDRLRKVEAAAKAMVKSPPVFLRGLVRFQKLKEALK